MPVLSENEPIRWKIYDARSAFAGFAADFDRLSVALYRPHPLLVSHFVAPLISHFADSDTRLCVARSGDSLVAMAVLVSRKPGIWSAFVPGQAQVAPLLIPAEIDLDDIFSVLPGIPIALEFLSQDPEFSFLLQANHSRLDEQTVHETTMNIVVSENFAEYWDARPKKLRSNIGRYFRRLEKDQHTWRFDVVTEPAAIAAALERYGYLESAGWKGQEDSAIHPDNAQGAFYAEVLHNFAQSGQARIYELYFDDELAASRIAVSSGKLLVMLKTTYLEAMRQYSPGRLLLNLVLQHEFAARQMELIEFYTDVTRDQLEWATGTRKISHLMHYRSLWLRGVIQCTRPIRALLAAIRH